MTLEYITGDLLASDEPALAHGCNTQGVMGSGIAKAIKETWPGLYQKYKQECEPLPGSKIHRYVIGDVMPYRTQDGRFIFNLATQEDPGPNAKLWAIQYAVKKMLDGCRSYGITRIGLPQIGCGIGGLLWPHVEGILEALQELYPEVQMTIYTLMPFETITLPSPLHGVC